MAVQHHKIKRIGIFAAEKVMGTLGALVGLILGILYSGLGAIYDAATGALGTGTALAFLALIGMPLIGGVYGFVIGTVGAFLYNTVARWTGGIEVELEKK